MMGKDEVSITNAIKELRKIQTRYPWITEVSAGCIIKDKFDFDYFFIHTKTNCYSFRTVEEVLNFIKKQQLLKKNFN